MTGEKEVTLEDLGVTEKQAAAALVVYEKAILPLFQQKMAAAGHEYTTREDVEKALAIAGELHRRGVTPPVEPKQAEATSLLDKAAKALEKDVDVAGDLLGTLSADPEVQQAVATMDAAQE